MLRVTIKVDGEEAVKLVKSFFVQLMNANVAFGWKEQGTWDALDCAMEDTYAQADLRLRHPEEG